MKLEQLNRNTYQSTFFYEKNGDVFLSLNLEDQGLNLKGLNFNDHKVSSLQDLQQDNFNFNPIDEVKENSVDGSYAFLSVIAKKISEINTTYDKELEKQPYAESFLKVLPPLVTSDDSKTEISWNLNNMKDKESIGKLLNGLNLKSENRVVQKNLNILNAFIYESIRHKVLEAPEGTSSDKIAFPTFNEVDFMKILNHKRLKNIFNQPENNGKLDETCTVLANNLNTYFSKIAKKEEFSKHFSRFKKYIRENPKMNLFALTTLAEKGKPDRDGLKQQLSRLKTTLQTSALITSERIFQYSVHRENRAQKNFFLSSAANQRSAQASRMVH
ncbi:MAG: hypothetical protein PHE89_05370 [Alphaproteobacteria bacterium]|nr:hypothetical protein [Alphaproteobacteria bacterium]